MLMFRKTLPLTTLFCHANIQLIIIFEEEKKIETFCLISLFHKKVGVLISDVLKLKYLG